MCLLRKTDMKRIFEKLDRNGDGLVSLDELSWLLERIGLEYSPKELAELLDIETSSFCLNYDEFLSFCDSILEAKPESRPQNDKDGEILEEEIPDEEQEEKDLFKAFSVFDLNGDGFITSEELQSVMSRLGLWDERSGRDCRSMICVYDRNMDGVLDFDEFKNMMLQANWLNLPRLLTNDDII